MKTLYLYLFLLLSLEIYSQGCSTLPFLVSISPSPTSAAKKDTSVCKGSALVLKANITNSIKNTTSYTVSTIPYIDTLPCESIGSLVAGTGINIDDAYSSVQNIGFNFSYFGSQFTQLQICDNGFLTFSTNKPVLVPNSAPFNAASLPLSVHPNPASTANTIPPNSIIGAWMDAFLLSGGANPGGGSITTQTVGVAPYRAYIVKWINCRFFNSTCRSNPSNVLNMKIVLYETSNLIDIYIKTKPICSAASPPRYNTTQGIQGDSMFKYLVSPGRNASLWDGASTAVRFSPNGTTAPPTISWSKNGVNIGTGNTVNITQNDDSTYYTATASITQTSPPKTTTTVDSIKVIGISHTINKINVYDTIYCQSSKSYNASTAGVVSYLWDNGSTSSAISISTSGIYRVVKKYEGINCRIDTVLYHIFKYGTVKIDSIQRIGCFNSQANGQIKIFASGDTNGIRYGNTLNPLSLSNMISGINHGSKMFWIKNLGNCRDSLLISLDSLKPTLTKKNNYCDQDSSGVMRLSIAGGYSPFVYTLTGRANQNMDSFTSLGTGTYTIGVTDKNGCSLSLTDSIKPFTNLSLSISVDSIQCFGDSTGKITATLSGGVAPYQFSINNGSFQSSGVFSNRKIGNYLIKTKDSKNCPIDTSISIYQYPELISNITIIDTIRCKNGNDGKILISSSGGKSPYLYSLNGSSYQSSPIFSNLDKGMKIISTKDAWNCIIFDTINLTEPLGMVSNLTIQNHVKCFGDSNAKAKIIVVGGRPPYIYTWSNGVNVDSNTNLYAASNHYVKIVDLKLCKDSVPFAITQPNPLTATLNLSHPKCHNLLGKIKVIGNGGISPYSYSIDGGSYQVVDSFVNLLGQSYQIKIKDTQQCITTYNTTLNNPTKVSATYSVDSVKCFGDNTGKITITALGGNGVYLYKKNGVLQPNSVFNNLSVGTYIVEISDSNNCKIDTTLSVYQYPIINAGVGSDTIKCFGTNTATLSISASGGLSNYQYRLNSGTYTSSSSFSSLSAGNYTIWVRDQLLCEKSFSHTIYQIDSIQILINKKDNKCFGDNLGEIKLSASGGTMPYDYSFMGSSYSALDSFKNLVNGNYTFNVRDKNNCIQSGASSISQPTQILINEIIDSVKCFKVNTGSIQINASGGTPTYMYGLDTNNFFLTNNFSNLAAGQYTLWVKDANQCKKNKQVQVYSSDSFHFTFSIDSIKCHNATNGRITLYPQGGKPPYQYRLNTGLFISSNILNNIPSGNHIAEIRDVYNCPLSLPFTIKNPDSIYVVLDSLIHNKCYLDSKGKIELRSFGGKPVHTYQWSNNATSSAIQNLQAGNYTLTVTDAQLCTLVKSYTIAEPSNLIINSTQVNLKCHGDIDGSISTSSTGATPPYTYLWNTSATSTNISGLKAGIYSLTVTDDNQCKFIKTHTLTQPDSIQFSTVKANSSCLASHNGSIEIRNLIGGVPPYSFNWSHGQATQNVYQLEPLKTYYITVSDKNSCTKNSSAYIDTNYELRVRIDTLTIPRCPYSSFSIQLTPLSGVPIYNYHLTGKLNFQNTNGLFSNTPNGSYSYEVKDINNCSYLDSISLIPVDTMSLNLKLYPPPCEDGNIFPVKADVKGGKAPYNYSWDRAYQVFNDSARYNEKGIYQLVVTDGYGCTISDRYMLELPDGALQIRLVKKKNITCYNQTDGELTIEAIGGYPPYRYTWSTGDTSTKISSLVANTFYIVTVYDSKNCRYVYRDSLSQPDSILIFTTSQDQSCKEKNDGYITALAKGGVANNSYLYALDSSYLFSENRHFAALTSNTYRLYVKDDNQCISYRDVEIKLKYNLQLTIDSLYQVKLGSTTTLVPNVSTVPNLTPLEYLWEPSKGLSCVDCLLPEFNGYQSQKYNLNVYYGEDCHESISTYVKVEKGNDEDIYIPNSFSPKAEKQENQKFRVYSNLVANFRILIFNRWGEKVYESIDIEEGWDGTFKSEPALSGEYSYIVSLVKLDGRKIERNGSVLLIK